MKVLLNIWFFEWSHTRVSSTDLIKWYNHILTPNDSRFDSGSERVTTMFNKWFGVN